ncbi:MAG: VWA domain-containing protein, partial [Chloroflexi bacterium]|nr:VWA domain-containing protein [Chloroflexota bacterium]
MPALTLGEYELAQPLGLLAILAIIPVAFALRAASARGRAADAAYGGPPEIRAGVSEWRRRARTALAVAAIVLIAIALARPRWGESDIAVERRGIDVAIALDVSRSMSAADAEPTRARAAARGLQDLLRHMRGDRVGLVTFAGSAFERSPLTTDLDALAQLVARSQGEAPLVSPGTDLGGAIEIALNVLSVDSAAKTQVVVLVSDGEDREPQDRGERLEVALSRARDKRVRVYTVLAGTEGGARLTDRAAVGDEVSRANPSALERIARETGGEVRAVDQIAGLAVDFRRMSQSLFEQERDRAPIERFQWFAGVALLLLLAQTALGDGVGRRRSVAAAAPAGAVLPALLALVLAGCAGTALYRV